tara:strand:- start:171 stop:395 length:225 start_codon:yes stop_codon:yes gene_type:complete
MSHPHSCHISEIEFEKIPKNRRYSRLRRDANTKDACVVAAHMAFLFSEVTEAELEPKSLFIMLSSRLFINVNHD